MNPLKNLLLKNKSFISNTYQLENGDTFISINSGHKFLSRNDEKKVKFILCDASEADSECFIKIPRLNENFIKWVDEIYNIKHKKFENFFITGTNGKTTAVHFLSEIFKKNDVAYASMGTLGSFLEENEIEGQKLTTENPLFIRKFLKKVQNHTKHVFFEASSIGINQKRLAGLEIKHVGFTSFAEDHLDYHKTTSNYLSSKLELLSNRSLETLAFNQDMNITKEIKQNANARSIFSISSSNKKAEIYYEILDIDENGWIRFDTFTPWGQFSSNVRLWADYNVLNLLISLPYYYYCFGEIKSFFRKIENILLPNGRFEVLNFKTKHKKVIIDFAHTPEAMEKLLSQLSINYKEKIYLVFGCGGDRDKGKRPKMGAIAEKYATKIFLTSDNSRSESTDEIIDMIAAGIKDKLKIQVNKDREKAIQLAINSMSQDNVLVVAGRGHENFQIEQGNRLKFSDREIVKKCLA